jgi:hypothetical protein
MDYNYGWRDSAAKIKAAQARKVSKMMLILPNLAIQ